MEKDENGTKGVCGSFSPVCKFGTRIYEKIFEEIHLRYEVISLVPIM